MSYAVVWCENGGPVYAGGLELSDRCVLLAGRAREALESRRKVFYEELADVRVERRPRERLDGRPTLALELTHEGSLVRIAPVTGAGVIPELVERLAAVRGKAAA
jgi:hypothetical protein